MILKVSWLLGTSEIKGRSEFVLLVSFVFFPKLGVADLCLNAEWFPFLTCSLFVILFSVTVEVATFFNFSGMLKISGFFKKPFLSKVVHSIGMLVYVHFRE